MKVLVCCERSQIVTDAFLKIGADAYSCDILASYGDHPDRHILGDAIEALYSQDWDLVIAHPPCTYLTNAGSMRMYHKGKLDLVRYGHCIAARDFFMKFYNYPGRICIENPVPLQIAELPPYSQIIHPYYFGDPYSKRTCLWLKKLPGLFATCICEEYSSWVYDGYKKLNMDRQSARSNFFPGIANAMASQWGHII